MHPTVDNRAGEDLAGEDPGPVYVKLSFEFMKIVMTFQ